MLQLAVVLVALPIASSFSLHHTSSASFIGRYLSRSNIVRSMSANSNINEFATASAIPPELTQSTEDIPPIDFDKLSEESAAQAFQPKSDLSDMYVKEERKAPRQAQWFPMLLSPTSLDGALAGDVGFDPLGFANDKAALWRMREAEIKHSRLAMLAAAGWPMSELWHKEIADVLGLDSILAQEGKAPSVLNGGLDNQWVLAVFAFVLVVGASLEFSSFKAVSRIGSLHFNSSY